MGVVLARDRRSIPINYLFMPTLISETDVKLERGDLLQRVMLPRLIDRSNNTIVPPMRAPGLHLSGLLRYVALKSKITAYIHDAEEEDAIERGHLPLRWFLGQIVEEGLASLYPYMLWQPGEMFDPLIMNCDGVSSADETIALLHGLPPSACFLEEFKCRRTKKISGVALMKKWIFMQQGLGYCLGYGAEYVRWHILSLFEFPDPVYTQYLIHFSQKELDESRRMIDINRESAVEAGFAEYAK